MRAVGQVVLVAAVVAACVVGRSAAVDTTAISRPMTLDIKSIAPGLDKPVGIAHPVIVTFNQPITDRAAAERALAITSVPAMSGRYEWPEANMAQWIPDRYWPADSTVKLFVDGKPKEFATGPAVIGVASISQHTFTVTKEGVPTASQNLPAPHHLPRAGEAGVFPATMGRPEYPTPVGTYAVLAKERSVVMDSSSVGIPVNDPDGYLLTVDHAVRFTSRGLFVHSAPWAVPAMGVENVSHGCVSLSPAAAEWYFNTVNIGDPVVIQP